MDALTSPANGSVQGALYQDVLAPIVGNENLTLDFQRAELERREIREVQADDRWFRIVVEPVQNAQGVITGTVHVWEDITERKQTALQQRTFLREVLSSVTEKRLRLCDTTQDLPPRLTPVGEKILLSAPMLRVLRRRVREVCAAQGFPEEREQDLETAVGEAAMNAVVHAGGGTAHVCVAANGAADAADGNSADGIVQIWVEDDGTGIRLENLSRATLERGHSTAGSLGHGFWLVLQTADRVWLLTGTDGTTVVIEQEPRAPEPEWFTRAA